MNLAGVELLKVVFSEASEIDSCIVITEASLYVLHLCLNVQEPVLDEQKDNIRQIFNVSFEFFLSDWSLLENFIVETTLLEQMQQLQFEEIQLLRRHDKAVMSRLDQLKLLLCRQILVLTELVHYKVLLVFELRPLFDAELRIVYFFF